MGSSSRSAGQPGFRLARSERQRGPSSTCQCRALTTWRKSAAYLNTLGLNLIGLDQDAEDHYSVPDYTVPTAIVVGSEERGISPGVRSACQSLISIPLRGQMASLNASVAAAIVLYEAVRQRSRPEGESS